MAEDKLLAYLRPGLSAIPTRCTIWNNLQQEMLKNLSDPATICPRMRVMIRICWLLKKKFGDEYHVASAYETIKSLRLAKHKA